MIRNDQVKLKYHEMVGGAYTGKGILNQSAEDYLLKTQEPKLLLCCGHIKETEQRYSQSPNEDDGKDLRDYFMHGHNGWYTVDERSEIHPDLVASIYDEETLRYLSDIFRNQLKIVYVEGWRVRGQAIHKMAYQVLREGGIFLYTVGQQYMVPYQRDITATAIDAGFTYDNIKFLVNQFAYENARRLRRAISRFPQAFTIEEIDDKVLLTKLVSSLEDNDRMLAFMFKMAYLDGHIQHSMSNLKMLSSYDPFLGWGLSFEYDRIAYVLMKK